ncbi:Protein tweety 3 [Liparis tanakae]|uniref:Protein tweety homolog n=1 Tax=Liparis tanakae TaxID=230148 RepID=A0A4Z2HR40_9TELE|nr:Protein tweety 3 [Liparis tanakae]
MRRLQRFPVQSPELVFSPPCHLRPISANESRPPRLSTAFVSRGVGLGEASPYAEHADYLSIVQKLQGQLDELVRQMGDIPFWENADVSLEELAVEIELYDWYRWLGYIGLLLFDVLICLLVLFGLIRNSKATLIGVCLFGVVALVISWVSLGLELAVSATSSDFCAAPDMYVMEVADQFGVINRGMNTPLRRPSGDVKRPLRNTSAEDFPLHNVSLPAPLCERRRSAEGSKRLLANRAREASDAESSTNGLFALKWMMKLCFAAGGGDILQHYLSCSLERTNPFQQKLSGSHKALVEMQDDVSELLRSATREYKQTQGRLEEIQGVLNTTEISLHQLTALVDCRSLHMVRRRRRRVAPRLMRARPERL